MRALFTDFHWFNIAHHYQFWILWLINGIPLFMEELFVILWIHFKYIINILRYPIFFQVLHRIILKFSKIKYSIIKMSNKLNKWNGSNTDGMKVLVFDSISEHFRFVFSDHTVIDMGSWAKIVVNTSGNGFSYQSNCFFSCHVILILGFKNGHGLKRSRTHCGEGQIRVTVLKIDYFPPPLIMTRCGPSTSYPPQIKCAPKLPPYL